MSLIRWKPASLHCPSQQTLRSELPAFQCSSRSHLSRSLCGRRPAFRSIPRLKFPGGAPSRLRPIVSAKVAQMPSLGEVDKAEVLLSETFHLERSETVEGKVTVRLDPAGVDKKGNEWTLAVGCSMEGKWTLHWGVTYLDDTASEWDQPPPEMRPPDSVLIKDYAIETPFKKVSSSSKGDILHEVNIDFGSATSIAAIHFVLKEEETGSWYNHKGRDFRISFTDDNDDASEKQRFGIWPGPFSHLSNLLRAEGPTSKQEDQAIEDKDTMKQNICITQFYKEFPVFKQQSVTNHMTVFVKKCNDTDKKLVQFDTDLPGDVIVHWGVCKNDGSEWAIPSTPHPPETKIFRQKALQTLLQRKKAGVGSWGLFLVDEETLGVVFALKFNNYTWLNNMGTDYYVPVENVSSLTAHERQNQPMGTEIQNELTNSQITEETGKAVVEYTDGIINEIRNLVTDMSSEKGQGFTTKETQENILQEIERLAAEAYSIFTSSPSFAEPVESISTVEAEKPVAPTRSGTGSGYEILCQGFNWESHKSGRWYSDLSAKTKELASLGFTVVWLPPPTESVSPEGYMPKDLYNLNSRYGNMEELQNLVKGFHEVGIKVLGDVVLNHRCAHYKNENGVWNMFGGRLNWDSRAIVGDDPHFQGRGNKSSGDIFHAAPNIDHSQEFVRNDIMEWLRWLRQEVGYDGWRLDFVRGFWGGYVKDYLEATDPHFVVGEFWDSLSYTYGDMDHNQDAHRQRIIDWINATNGKAGAFDVTTKGVLHSAIERCEYWRLCDQKGKPPGVVGWWPSRAVTFIENHDTGSTQGHWRFPGGKELQGYAYILTHPGTPAVFYDHIFSHLQKPIAELISIRDRNKIHCRSTVKITKSERDVYAAHVDERIAVKLGPGHYQPDGSKKWTVVAEGGGYKVWEASSS